MKKVMLVDDEILVRESIRDCVNWSREGFEYCADASDGELALPLLEAHRPDILITDIKMPFMNGLELSSVVRERYPDTKIIILSGHDEFEYARSALRIGVEEYCLKPVSAADIVELLREMSSRIDREREAQAKLEKRLRGDHELSEWSADKLLRDLCGGFVSTADAIWIAAKLGVELSARHYAVVMTDIRSRGGQSAAAEEASGSLPAMTASLQACMSELTDLMYAKSRTERVWILKSDSQEQLLLDLSRFRDAVKTAASLSPEWSIAAGAGSVQDRLQGLHASYLDAEEEKYWHRLAMQNRRLLWDVTGGTLDTAVQLDRTRYLEFLRVGSPAQTETFVRQICDGLRGLDWQTTVHGCYMLNDLTIEVCQAAKAAFQNVEDLEETLQRLQRTIDAIRTWEEACRYIMKLTEQYWTWRSGAADRYADMLADVRAYVQANYANDSLSLQDAAQHVSISPSHLSKVFSQETGQTFIEYVTATRIRKAMELLNSTNAKSYEVAHQVGYNDAHYFSHLFRKITGMTIRDYRKQGLPS
jgi:two-component system, response regulator YesN